MRDTRIELLQQMPVFGGIRADVLQTLLDLCPVVSIAANEYFFREHDQANSMFVIESGNVAILKNWRGQEHLLKILKEGPDSRQNKRAEFTNSARQHLGLGTV